MFSKFYNCSTGTFIDQYYVVKIVGIITTIKDWTFKALFKRTNEHLQITEFQTSVNWSKNVENGPSLQWKLLTTKPLWNFKPFGEVLNYPLLWYESD